MTFGGSGQLTADIVRAVQERDAAVVVSLPVLEEWPFDPFRPYAKRCELIFTQGLECPGDSSIILELANCRAPDRGTVNRKAQNVTQTLAYAEG